MDRQELLGKLSARIQRQFVPYTGDDTDPQVFCVYADEALTGFLAISDPPKMGEFNGEKCVLLPLSSWALLANLADRTVTPFRLVAVGKTIRVAAWMPHTGLKYAVRNTEYGAMVHVPLSEFKEL